ncbi:DUF4190 domain-containing protein [Actinoplanes solisilvae]|uniref:DUF4190 domain-containing protein n=1 Tax=Actinoplanes solisilvae TaxID=2486853 RepID=UPI00196A65BF|nr:DUF4190 domain-containing protein [Actinoplanes solisilvae]
MTTPPPPPPPPPYYGPPAGQPAQQNTQGLVGMIVGILSIPLACCGFAGVLGIVLGIVGGVFSWLGLQKSKQGLASNRGQALAGLICSAVGVAFGIIAIILVVAFRDFDVQNWIDQNSNN